MGRFFRHSLALQAARLSVGLGGIAGMVLLPGVVAQSGFGVLAGYFLALLLLGGCQDGPEWALEASGPAGEAPVGGEGEGERAESFHGEVL